MWIFLQFFEKNIFFVTVFNIDAYTSRNNFSGVMVLSTMFCITAISVVYNIEKWFSDSSMGQVGALCIFVLIGALFLIIKMCLDFLWYIPYMLTISYYLSWIFAVLPSFSLASGLIDMGEYLFYCRFVNSI